MRSASGEVLGVVATKAIPAGARICTEQTLQCPVLGDPGPGFQSIAPLGLLGYFSVSTQANTYFNDTNVEGSGFPIITLLATRDIEAGEEVTVSGEWWRKVVSKDEVGRSTYARDLHEMTWRAGSRGAG
jgi:hypothetical protein